MNATDSYNQDIKKIHSQGLEMLLTPRSDILFGGGGDMFTKNVLMDSAYIVLMACMMNDFEKQLYYGYVTTAEGIADL